MRDGGVLDYGERLRRERETFADQRHIHGSLPPSAHRWSNRHIRPKLESLGVPSVEELITAEVSKRAENLQRDVMVLSLGSGNGDQEISWLRALAEIGVRNVRMRLLEVNPEMQRRARQAAEQGGFADRIDCVVADFNSWQADTEHDVVVGFQALHHVLELEHLYGQIRDSLHPSGVLVVHDMIGRNGHRRWPEALEVIERIWSTLPPELRHNAITGEVDQFYDDIDCAGEGFEGVRAQDVLPVLLDYLHPGLFLAYGNVIDPFVDRVYGGNFDMDRARDRMLIDHLGVLDDTLIDLGSVTPTRLIATFHPDPQPLRVYGDRTPQHCIRDPDVIDRAGRVSFHPVASDGDRLVRGAGVVIGRMNGVARDHWAAPGVEVPLLATGDVECIEVSTFVPEWFPRAGRVTMCVDGAPEGTLLVEHGLVEHTVPVRIPAGSTCRLTLDAEWSCTPKALGVSPDQRNLSYVLVGMTLSDGSSPGHLRQR